MPIIAGLFTRVAGQLRVRRPEVRFETADEERPPDGYIERLVKLIPSEVVGAYVAGRVIAAEHSASTRWAVICFFAVLVFRSLATATIPPNATLSQVLRVTWRTAQWLAVGISAVSFVIWVQALGDHLPWVSAFLPQWGASLALLLWTPLVSYLYKGS